MEELFDSSPGDVAEQNCRNEVIQYVIVSLITSITESLFSKFKDIEEHLQFLSEEPNPQELTELAQDPGEISQVLEDLWETMFEYKVCP